MKYMKKNEKKKRKMEKSQEFGNVFTLSDEEEYVEEEYQLKKQFHEKWKHKVLTAAEMVREEDGWHNPWKKQHGIHREKAGDSGKI